MPFQAMASVFNTKQTNEARKRESELAYKRSIEDWRRQNKYNDPSAQMARLKAAGLNPNMIYGSGTAAATGSGAPASPPKYSPADQEYNIQAPSSALSMLSQYQNIEKTKADTALKWGELGIQALQVDSATLTIEQKELQNEILRETGTKLAESKVEQSEANIESTKQKTKESKARTENILQSTENLKETINNIEKQGKQIDAQTDSIRKLIELNEIRRLVENKNWEWFRDYQIKPSDPSYMKYIIDIAQKTDTPENRSQLKKALDYLGDWDSNLEYLKDKVGW